MVKNKERMSGASPKAVLHSSANLTRSTGFRELKGPCTPYGAYLI